MPVYLCKPGVFASEPWRHGIPVYAEPFRIGSTLNTDAVMQASQQQQQQQTPGFRRSNSSMNQPNSETSSVTGVGNSGGTQQVQQQQQEQQEETEDEQVNAIRRIRHGEVVLVDDVVSAYDNFWLRLRWPGSKGGFAGYVCLVTSQNTIIAPASNSSNTMDKMQPSGEYFDCALYIHLFYFVTVIATCSL